MSDYPDFRPAPNIGDHPDVYERENAVLDPDGHVLHAMREMADWDGHTMRQHDRKARPAARPG
jgi:hypothetical protein